MVTRRRKGRRTALRRRARLVLRVSALHVGHMRELRRARDAVLLHLRRRRTGLIRKARRLLRQTYNSRVKRVARNKIRVSLVPQTRRRIKERMQRLKSYLQRRPRRLVQLKRVLARAVPEHRVRRQLHRLVRRISATVVRSLPAPRSKHFNLRRGGDLQNIIYTARKKRGHRQYSKLYGRYTMTSLGRARLAVIRFLRLERQRSQQKACARRLRPTYYRKTAARRARRPRRRR